MGCGASKSATNVQPVTIEKKPVLPPIDSKSKTKTPSAKSNGSADSGIEDSEPARTKPEKNTFNIDSFLVEHHQKSRLGNAETFEIVTAARPGRLAPLKHVPKLSSENKNNANIDESDLQAKIAAKLERASRKRREIENARRQASSRIGHRTVNKPTFDPRTTNDETISNSLIDERHQQLSLLRDQLRQNSNNNTYAPPHTPRAESVNSSSADIANLTPRRGGHVIGATTASNFKPVYD